MFSIARKKDVPEICVLDCDFHRGDFSSANAGDPQYFAYCFPFLIVATVCLVHDLLAELESRSARLIGAGGTVALLAIYLVAPVNDFHRYLVTGEGIPGLERVKDKEDWRVQRILEVSRAIDGMTSPGETVISLWPGFLFPDAYGAFARHGKRLQPACRSQGEPRA